MLWKGCGLLRVYPNWADTTASKACIDLVKVINADGSQQVGRIS